MTGTWDEDESEMLAAELVLGLLEDGELNTVRRRASEDPAFARRIVAWEADLAQLADLPEVAASPAVKQALMGRLFSHEVAIPFWQRLLPWQVLAGGALAATLFLAVLINSPPTVPAPATGPLYSAEIVAEAGDFRVVALLDKTREEVVLYRTAGAAPQGRILQVWAHGPGEPAQSVGLWPEAESIVLALPPDIASVRGTLTLGVSEEPPGGSTTGSPSGRVFGTVDIPGVGGSR